MRRRVILAAILCAAAAHGGCSHTYDRDWIADGYQAESAGLVAVLPLENHTAQPNAGETISELLATEFRVRGFDVLDGHEVRHLLGLTPEDEGRTIGKADLRALAERLDVDSLVAGSVGEFRYKRDLGEDPVVGFSVRMYDRKRRQVVWATSHSRSEFGLLYHRDYLHENAQRIAEDMVDFLMDEAAEDDPLPPTKRRPRAGKAGARGSSQPAEGSAPPSKAGGKASPAGESPSPARQRK